MKGLRALMLLLLLPAFHALASDSEEERVAAAKRYLAPTFCSNSCCRESIASAF